MSRKIDLLYEKIFTNFIRGVYGPPKIPNEKEVLTMISIITDDDTNPITKRTMLSDIFIEYYTIIGMDGLEQPFSHFYKKYIREEKVKYYKQHFQNLVPRSLSQENDKSLDNKIKEELHNSHQKKRFKLLQLNRKLNLNLDTSPKQKDLSMRSLGQKSISRLQLGQIQHWMEQQL